MNLRIAFWRLLNFAQGKGTAAADITFTTLSEGRAENYANLFFHQQPSSESLWAHAGNLLEGKAWKVALGSLVLVSVALAIMGNAAAGQSSRIHLTVKLPGSFHPHPKPLPSGERDL